MNNKLIWKITFLFLLFFCKLNFAQDLFDTAHTSAYAKYLQTSKQYKLASEEYERLLFFNPNNDVVLSKLFYNERKSGNAQAVKNRFEKLYPNFENVSEDVFSQYLQCLVSLNLSKQALESIEKNRKISAEQKFVLNSYAFISVYDWEKALQNLNQVQTKNTVIIKTSDVLIKAKDTRYKKPILAAGLSAVVPGLGKVYTGNVKDGIISFVFVGINAFQSFRYYEKKGIKSAGAWIFGSLATGFYLGNIYGSYKAAIIKNKKIKDAYKKQLQEITDMD